MQRRGKKKKKNPGTKSNNSRCSISVRLRYASFQVLSSPCEIDSQHVENLHPVGIVVQTHARSLRCPGMPAVLPPPLLLTAPISTPCSIVSVCLCSKITYLRRSVQGWLCGSHNGVKRGSSTPVIGHWVCASVVQPKFYSFTYFSCFYSSMEHTLQGRTRPVVFFHPFFFVVV